MSYQYRYNHQLVPLSKANKKIPTDAEKLLWFHLRGRQVGGYKFRRQYPVSSYILDFYCVEIKLGIELDGSQHILNELYDLKREQQLKALGIKIIRFWDNDVFSQTRDVLEKILFELKNL